MNVLKEKAEIPISRRFLRNIEELTFLIKMIIVSSKF